MKYVKENRDTLFLDHDPVKELRESLKFRHRLLKLILVQTKFKYPRENKFYLISPGNSMQFISPPSTLPEKKYSSKFQVTVDYFLEIKFHRTLDKKKVAIFFPKTIECYYMEFAGIFFLPLKYLVNIKNKFSKQRKNPKQRIIISLSFFFKTHNKL